MWPRMRALFLRYAGHHADRLAGFTFRHRGRRVGHLERVWRADDGIRMVGWSAAQSLRVCWAGGRIDPVPRTSRSDVMHRFGLPLDAGFEIALPGCARLATLHAVLPCGAEITVRLPHPSDPLSVRARRRLVRAFLRDVLRALPAIVHWVLTHDPAARARIKRSLGLDAVIAGLPIDARWLNGPPSPRSVGPITVIMPVHNAFDLLPETLGRLERNTDVPWQLILIDDASSDPRVRPFLRGWAARSGGRAMLVELDRNLGFVGAVNHGLARALRRGCHVIVLNSDALLPQGWASRLIAPFARDPSIASATPMSNDAEIFSVPQMCRTLPLAPGMGDCIDAVAQQLSWPDVLPSAPTGVGFCMAMHANWLARFPRFDPAFGRGYGEEVDWCQKTRAAGARHVGVPTVFVEHLGAQSFGASGKRHRVATANAMIARRYPAYDAEVQHFIASDPLRTPWLALAVALAGGCARDGLPVFVAHSLGGGAEIALMAEVATYTARGEYAVILRLGGPLRWQFELHGPGGARMLAATMDLADLMRLLAPVPALRLVYSCGVGDPDPIGLPHAMLALMRPGQPDRLEARLHDYFMISPAYDLRDAQGAYRGPVLRGNTDPAHQFNRADGRVVSLGRWQDEWHRFLSRCAEITVFSQSGTEHLLASYPDLGPRIVLRPHRALAPVGRVAAPSPGSGRLAVLGDINDRKGAGVLCGLAAKIERLGGPGLALIGNIDPAFGLPAHVALHGRYAPSDIADLARRYRVVAWLMPSIWPETFSFSTREMLATGLPVFGFDIGAQGEALRHAPNGIPIPFDPDSDHAGAVLASLAMHGPWRLPPSAAFSRMAEVAP